jgi:hypothetical protein
MSEISAKEVRDVHAPSWGWSGVAVVRFEADEHRLREAIHLLPQIKSSLTDVTRRLVESAAKFQRRLHQDEFGPDRKRQTSSLRSLEKSLRRAIKRLLSGRTSLKQMIDASLKCDADPRDSPIDALLQVTLDLEYTTKQHFVPIQMLCATLSDLKLKLDNLDTNTAGQLFEYQIQSNFDPSKSVDYSRGLIEVQSWLDRYLLIVNKTLSRLNNRRGADERVSLKALVFELCDFWESETGFLVTAHAMVKDHYTSRVQTPSGRFVTGAVEAILPNQAWFDARVGFANSVRARTFLPGHAGARARQIVAIMREFVKRRLIRA